MLWSPKNSDYVWLQRFEKVHHNSQIISVAKYKIHFRKSKIFCFDIFKANLLNFSSWKNIPLPTTTINVKQFNRDYTQWDFWGGQLEPNRKFFVCFFFFAQLQVWVAYSAGSEQQAQQEKEIKMENEIATFSSQSFQIIPEVHRRFTVIIYIVLACFVVKWVNQSSQVLNLLEKYWPVELCQLRKKWPIDFSLSVTKGNVLSITGRIDGLFLLIIKVKSLN